MVTTNDPFFRSWFLSGRAAYHINDAFAIEVGGGYVPPFLVEKLPPVDVLREQAFLINADAKLLGLLDAGVTFSPLYGKVAVLSDQIIHFDAFVIAGGGAVFDTNKTFVHPAMDVGAGVRVFILRWLVVRADLRDYVYPQDRTGISTLQNLLLVSLGVGFYFPFDFTYQYEAAKVR
jgi:outer membrane beta-barrel protein